MDLAGSTTPSTIANVRVVVRIRPLSVRERQNGSTECISVVPGVPQIIVGPERSFTYDDVFGNGASQTDIFAGTTEPILKYFLAGYNCTILAYGQTGSGKTFTMGTGLDGNIDGETQGIVPRSVEHILQELPPHSDSSWEMFVSFLEIYNEDIIDLLSPLTFTSGKKNSLSIREDAGGEIYLTGIKEEPVRSSSDIFRTTKSTDMNMVSSRSHAIFTVTLKQQASEGQFLCSKLHFVDLAGSERRTNATGERARESININSGLLALGNVISALGDESKHATHIPYRDSKLTRLLQDSLGGNSRTLMIACVSPSTDNYSETLNTLKYANRARNIKNRIQINQDPNGSAAFEIVQLKKQIAGLKQELLQARSRYYHSSSSSSMSHHHPPPTPSRLTRSDSSIGACGSGEELLRTQNKELQRRYDELLREKLDIEAERDALMASNGGAVDADKASIIRQHLQTIATLRAKLQEKGKKTVKFQAEPNRQHGTPKSPRDVVTEGCELVGKARKNISEKLALIDAVSVDGFSPDVEMQSISMDQFKAAIETRVQTLLRPLREDLGLKEELTHSLHSLQLEYMAMQQKYNEQIKFLHDTIGAVQRERDNVIANSCNISGNNSLGGGGNNSSGSNNVRMIRVKYEDRIRRMGKEINELKERLEHQNKESVTRSSSSEALLRSLRQTVQSLKGDKARLQSQLNEETVASKGRRSQQESDAAVELAELRSRERRALETAKKWHKAYDFQKTLLQKRIEQCALARVKVRGLLQVLRRHRIRIESGCDTPGWRQILQTPSHSPSRDLKMAIGDTTATAMMMMMVGDDDNGDNNGGFANNSPCGGGQQQRASNVSTPKSRLAYGWVPTEMMARHLSPERPKPRDFFAQIADAASLSIRASISSNNNTSTNGPASQHPQQHAPHSTNNPNHSNPFVSHGNKACNN